MTYKLSARILELPMEFTFTISRSSTAVARTVLVELQYQNHTGLGEAVPAQFYGESPESVLAFYDQLNLDNLDPFDQQSLEALFAKFPGNMAAKSGLEIAFWDLRGKLLNLPVWKLWGLNPANSPKTSYTIGIADLDTVTLKTNTALERGYDILKVKLGSPSDLECLQLIRKLAPDVTIRVDANAAWSIKDALKLMPVLVECRVEFIEEPLKLDSSEKDYQRLKAESPILLMADESCKKLKDIPRCAALFGSINLKHTKTGGLTEAMRMIHAARAHGMKIMLGCFAESSISISAFAQLSPLVDYTDLDGALLLANDPYTGLRWEANRFFLSDRSGIGIENCASSNR